MNVTLAGGTVKVSGRVMTQRGSVVSPLAGQPVVYRLTQGNTAVGVAHTDANGRYTDKYVASFIGFLPAAQPRVVIAAIIDEPSTIYGGVAAAPLFQEVARFAIQRLAIEPAARVKLPPRAFPSP